MKTLSSVALDSVHGGQSRGNFVDPNLGAANPPSDVLRVCGENGCPNLQQFVDRMGGAGAYAAKLSSARQEVAGKQF